ncbi:PIR Superfamily Protein [Plasmodium ovale curtisi]|uniref:PIR Superfamily Protein n=1 Tax=Plasmodium ovale curtisi TaxID=864141 RepID=A0A1A8XDP0_PLAOA|nr:PIR Superfamily Protein [Plasmodium ovale curtisi]
MADQEDFKYNLKSINHYKYLDTYYKFGGSQSECDLLRREFPSKEGIYDFCLSLRGNLEYFDNLKNLDLFTNDKCQYLNCWIHDRLLNLGFDIAGESTTIFLQILKYFTFFKLDEKCKYEFFHIDKKKYEKMKKLYDYILDFMNIKWYANTYGCSEENKEYINERRRIYQEVKVDCEKNTSQPYYCIVLKHLKEAYKNDELTSFECTKMKSSPPRAQLGETLQGAHHGDSGDLQHALGPGSDHPREFPTTSAGQTEESSFPSSTPMAVFFPFLGSLLSVFTLYRFTPMGPWLRTRFLPKKMDGTNMGEVETFESVENDYENVNLTPHISKHLIGYNP